MRIIKAVAVLVTILEVSAICWSEAAKPNAMDLSFPTPQERIPSVTRVTDCVAIDFDAADETAGSLLLPN
jgi:hypothetical protein